MQEKIILTLTLYWNIQYIQILIINILEVNKTSNPFINQGVFYKYYSYLDLFITLRFVDDEFKLSFVFNASSVLFIL